MAKCEVCCEYIARAGETPDAVVVNGDRPWRVVDGPMDQEDGTQGWAGIDDGDHEHVPARVVTVSTYSGGAACSWDNRCGYTAMFMVGDAPVCIRDMSDAVTNAI